MPNPTNITYGSYSFRDMAGPIPHPSIVVNHVFSDDGTQLFTRYNMTLENVLTPFPSGIGGYTNLDAMQDNLVSGFSIQGQNLLITCNGSELLSVYPRISEVTLDRSNDNWVHTTPYTIKLEWEGESFSGDIWVEGVTETWDMQFSEDVNYYNWLLPGGTGDNNSVLVNLTHTVAAKGVPHYTSSGLVAPYINAKNFVVSRLGYNASEVAQVGVLNLNAGAFSPYNHMRVVQEDKYGGGGYSCTENWILTTGYRAIEDFTASIRYNTEDTLTVVDIQGNIQGLESRTYGTNSGQFAITESKWSAASGYWNSVKPKLYGRVQLVASLENSSTINPVALDYTVGHNPSKGIINYAYTYDTRRCLFASGVVSEKISISDVFPTDVFASIVIPGRGKGPIGQDLETITEYKRVVSIDITLEPPTGCDSIVAAINNKPTGEIMGLLCALESDLVNEGNKVFKSADSDSFDLRTGRYSRNVEWTVFPCTNDPHSTSFCD